MGLREGDGKYKGHERYSGVVLSYFCSKCTAECLVRSQLWS